MKRLSLLLLMLLLLLLPFSVKAEEAPTDQLELQTKEGLLALLPDAAKPILPDPTDSDALEDALGFQGLFALFVGAWEAGGTAVGGRMLSLLAITLLFGAISLFTANTAVSLFMQGAASLSFFSLLYGSCERIFGFFSDLAQLSAGLAPLLSMLFAAGGGTATATMAGGAFASFLSILTLFSTTLLPPLLRVLFALALLSALGNHTLIRELSKRISGLAVLLFSVLSMLLLASLAFQSSLASSADSVALRTVKYTASSAIPLVGSTLSGALGALSASVSLLKSALGGTAVIALLSLLLPPLTEVFLLRLALSFSESVATFTEATALRETVARYKGIMDLALASLVIVSILFLLMVGMLAKLSPLGGG